MGSSIELLTATPFSKLDKWYVELFLYSSTLQSKYPMIKLEKIICPRGIKIKPEDIPDNGNIVSKIRFSNGEVLFKKRKIKNDMILSSQGDLLVSNINFEKGAFAINIWNDIYASTDYTSYILNSSIVIPDYLNLTLRSEVFLSHVARLKPQGMKTRARYEFIKDFSIPVPSISKQQSILNEYYKLMAQAEKLEKEAIALEESIDEYLYDILLIEDKPLRKPQSHSILKQRKFSRLVNWSIGRNSSAILPEELFVSKKYKNKLLSNICDMNPDII